MFLYKGIIFLQISAIVGSYILCSLDGFLILPFSEIPPLSISYPTTPGCPKEQS